MPAAAVLAPAFSPEVMERLTRGLRRLPLRFHDAAYPPLGPDFRLALAKNTIHRAVSDTQEPPSQVVLIGYSTGGYLAAQVACEVDEPPAGLVLIAAPASWSLRRSEPGWSDVLSTLATKYALDAAALEAEMEAVPPDQEPAQALRRRPVPTLYIRGSSDQNISRSHAQAYRDALEARCIVTELRGDHFLRGAESELARQVGNFLRRIEQPRPAGGAGTLN